MGSVIRLAEYMDRMGLSDEGDDLPSSIYVPRHPMDLVPTVSVWELTDDPERAWEIASRVEEYVGKVYGEATRKSTRWDWQRNRAMFVWWRYQMWEQYDHVDRVQAIFDTFGVKKSSFYNRVRAYFALRVLLRIPDSVISECQYATIWYEIADNVLRDGAWIVDGRQVTVEQVIDWLRSDLGREELIARMRDEDPSVEVHSRANRVVSEARDAQREMEEVGLSLIQRDDTGLDEDSGNGIKYAHDINTGRRMVLVEVPEGAETYCPDCGSRVAPEDLIRRAVPSS